METTETMETRTDDPAARPPGAEPRGWRRRVTGRLVVGAALAAAGVWLLFDRLGLFDFDFPWGWWPLILVAIGAGKVVAAEDPGEQVGGGWMIAVGIWLVINFEGYFGLDWSNSWPLLMVAAGILMVWRALAERSGGDGAARRGEG